MTPTATPPAPDASEPFERLRNAIAHLIAENQLPVPLLPQVAAEVMRETSNDTTDASRLSGLIHKDPGLAAQIVRIANSAAYRGRMSIVSLQQAVARLGLTTVREIAFTASIQSGVFRVPSFESELRSLWRQSLATATYAQQIAKAKGLEADGAFLCGLLYRIGAPVLLQLGIDQAKKQGLSTKKADVRLQIFRLASEAAGAAGASVAAAWKLPAPVGACMLHWEAPEQAGTYAKDAALVSLAAELAQSALAPDGTTTDCNRESVAATLLGFTPQQIEGLLADGKQVRERVDLLTGA